ncbi:hypothetical protein CDAR_245801 [Caerostris darwini]|uniref:Secreted protein n=1 Tax=Caerostris darwini TaxID=1538125 RepID=A0AAV4U3D4_9ARAC|nr:hypothetical protein CDAR_245801 [Caerostris darwini]
MYILKKWTFFLLVTTPLLSYHLTLFRLLRRQACLSFQVSKPPSDWSTNTLVELSPQRAPTNPLSLWKILACFLRRNTQAPPSLIFPSCVGCSAVREIFPSICEFCVSWFYVYSYCAFLFFSFQFLMTIR